MTTHRLGELLDALEQQASQARSQLESAHQRIHELEVRNQALEQRLGHILDAAGGGASADGPSSLHDTQAAAAAGESPGNAAPERDSVSTEHMATADEPADEAPSPSTGQQASTAVESSPSHGASEAEQPASQPPSPQALLKQWYQRYPNAFFRGHTRPLKIGIHHDLAEREPWPEKLIRRALAGYVNLPRYLKSVRHGNVRVDLDGGEAGEVSEQDAHHAAEQLTSLQQKQREREQQAQSKRMASKLSALASRHGHQ
ncbi:ProP effector [Kushneria sinocarnis]|uniref:ProP effector n=1 Tax=Kushneria sinocarnis TaxID=595502 RepID=A0A420WWU9_9GAMM|nr:ProQ/FINO family protein [Kushneria sinocarnis]RKR04195.1 ProP effector [Kushneria sinocarnis]